MSPAGVIVVLDMVEIDYIRFSWSGMVGRDLNRRLNTLQFRARNTVGVKTGQLKSSIGIERSVIKQGLEGKVGSPKRWAAPHHEGARPHLIKPRNAKALRFMVGGKFVFAKTVKHPGNRPNPYLTRWLLEAVR